MAGVLFDAAVKAPSAGAARAYAKSVVAEGACGASAREVQSLLSAALQQTGKKDNARHAALLCFTALCQEGGVAFAPRVLPSFEAALEMLGDKSRKVAAAANDACDAILAIAEQGKGVPAIAMMPMLIKAMRSTKFQAQTAALGTVEEFSKSACRPVVAAAMPELIPLLAELLHDTKAQVADGAKDTLEAVATVVDNKDIVPFVPALISALMNPEEVIECIYKLSAQVFVATVQRPELAMIGPLLVRGFRERATATVRQSAKITENMSRLVEVATEAEPLLPELIPALEKASDAVSDPECRGVCGKAHTWLSKLDNSVKQIKEQQLTKDKFVEKIQGYLPAKQDDADLPMLEYLAELCEGMVTQQRDNEKLWELTLTPVLAQLAEGAQAADIAKKLCADGVASMTIRVQEGEEEDSDDLLCDCKFTLAYGAKVLLKNTSMKLVRGKKYGLLGQNDCGKTTLLRAIAGKPGVDGFPDKDEVRTVFVEADILGDLSHLVCIEYIMADERIKEAGIPEAEVEKVMVSVGFTATGNETGGKYARVRDPVDTLSGGWRMKLALARAMLQKADVLLLDEPTNHLDVRNVNWVKEYLCGLEDTTCIIVSHNADLLQTCCSGMLHITDQQLKLHKCDLNTFVERHPESKSFFELKAQSSLIFKFPKPGYIEGVNSRGKALMKMDGVEWTYPGNPNPTVTGITVRVSMASRVACVGPNGAGKSTMIKLLTGELDPKVGQVWKHPNAKVAYVAQHAFHHIERHMNRTPVEYILWRFEHGTDKEGLEKSSIVMSEEEERKLKEKRNWEYTDNDGKVTRGKQVIWEMTGNRKEVRGGRSYEVRFEGLPREVTFWIRQDPLEENGWGKALREVDEKILARDAMYKRPLTNANVTEHLEGLGLDREFAAHHQMRALSNGQRVKVVLAACMWNQPHLVILDEPTNYLDRESLGALAGAIREYEGGVVLISHNNQFCAELCPETWVLERGDDGIGRCDCKGDAGWMEAASKEKVEVKQMETMVDAFGNETKVKSKKKLSRKERLAREKAKKNALELGEPWSSDDDM